MSQRVRILDFVHELQSAGVSPEGASIRAAIQEDPESFWNALPADQRARVTSRLQLAEHPDAPVRIRLVARRGRSSTLDDQFVEIEDPAAPPGPFRRAREAMLFRPLVARGAPREIAIAEEAFRREGPAATERLLSILDAAWDGDSSPSVVLTLLDPFELPDGAVELERYHIEKPFSKVVIWRDTQNRLTYSIVEPVLTELEAALMATVNERLRDLLVRHVDRERFGRVEELVTSVFDLLRIYRAEIDQRSAYRIAYHFVRNYLGFGRLDVLMRDPHIEDISCNGPGVPLYVVHSVHQNLCTDLLFDEVELNSFTIKLAQRGGKLLSIAQPLVDATLPGGSRIQASLGREITSRGSAFTIRKFREDPLTAVDLIRSGTHSYDSMAFLWLVAELRRNLVVMGATASGKTTTLNCLSQFIPPSVKIVTIEDTREITLQHENWLAAITREGFTGGGAEKVTMFDLLRAALRQRPEFIIVGEIRGAEGLTLFQAMSTGHTCFSTMHAGSVENAVYRLENAPIGVPRVMLTSLDFLLCQGQVEVDGKPVRRMLSLTEIDGIDAATRNLRTNDIFRWDAEKDRIDALTASQLLERTRAKRGWTRDHLNDEIAARRRVLERLVARKERDHRTVAKAVHEFYHERQVSG